MNAKSFEEMVQNSINKDKNGGTRHKKYIDKLKKKPRKVSKKGKRE